MSGKVNHALFDLIKSMTKSEKRYFKLVSSRHTIGEENNYIRLFDYIEKQEDYNEDQLFDDFNGEAFLNRFSITKKRLYDHILGALDSYHSGRSQNAQLYKQLHSAEILFEKSLYDQCRRVLNSCEKQAEKYELYEIMLLINKMKRKLTETIGTRESGRESVIEISNIHQKALTNIDRYQDLWNVKSDLFDRLQIKGVARTDEEISDYNNICSNVLNLSEEQIEDTELKYLYHHILSAYYYAVRDLTASLKHLQINISEMTSRETILSIEPNKHISVYTNAIYIADRIGEHRIAISYLNELKTYVHKLEPNEDQEIKLFSSISSIELSLKVRMGAFDEAVRIVPEIESKLESYGYKISAARKAFLSYKIAVAYVGINEFSKARMWINRVLNDPMLDKTEDIIGFTQLLDLLVQIELDNDQLLPYTLKSTQRFFKTRNRMYDFEKAILNFTSRFIKAKDNFEVKELWEELYDELKKITNSNELECTALEYFDFQSWAEAKLKQKSFDLIVREKYHQTIRPAC